MKMRTIAICILTSFLIFGYANQTLAYGLLGPKWPNAEATVYTKGSSNTLWNDAFIQAMARWNNLSNFTFYSIDAFSDPCADDGSRAKNSWAFEDTICGVSFGSTTLAVTGTLFVGSTILESDIVFNTNHNWNVFSGNVEGVIDF